MKSFRHFTKGILLSLILVMTLNTGLVTFLGGQGMFTPTSAYADDPPIETDYDTLLGNIKPPKQETPQDPKTASDLIKEVSALANKTHRLFAPVINVFAFHIGNFLGSDYVYQGSMGKMLQKIWVISRNLVNIAFVFILLWLALNTIFNTEFPLADLKKKLIWFTLLLIGVNFSWLGTKVVLDASNVMTHVVFAIPSGISDPPSQEFQCQVNGPDEVTKGPCYPTAIIAPADSGVSVPLYWEDKGKEDDNCAKAKKSYSAAYLEDGTPNPEASDNDKKLQGRTSICMENLNLFSYNQNTAVIYLTYGMARIQNLVSTVATQKAEDLAVSVLMSLVIQLAYTVSLLALFIALIIRMAMLWLFVGFSPFLVLAYAFSKLSETNPAESLNEYFSFSAFFKWAFVPAKVGAVFVVSFIMISAGQSLGDINITLVDKLNTESGFVFKIPAIQTIFSGIGTLQNFVWLIMCVVVLWMGVFAVLGDMKFIQTITEPIKTAGISLAKEVAAFPYKAPISFLGKGGAPTSVKQMLAPFNPTKRLQEYYGENIPEDVRTMNAKAKTPGARDAVNRAKSVGFTMNASEANKLAKALGLELSNFNSKDIKLRTEALKTAGATEEQATKIANDMAKFTGIASKTETKSAATAPIPRTETPPTPSAGPPAPPAGP